MNKGLSFISVLSIFSLYLWEASYELTERGVYTGAEIMEATTLLYLSYVWIQKTGISRKPTELANWYIIEYIWAYNNIRLPNYYDILEKCYKYRKFIIQISQIMFFWCVLIAEIECRSTWSSGNSRRRSNSY